MKNVRLDGRAIVEALKSASLLIFERTLRHCFLRVQTLKKKHAMAQDGSAVPRKTNSTEENLTRIWIWEYILKHSADATLIKALTEALPFPKQVPRLIQMLLIKELSFQAISKDFDVQKCLDLLEDLRSSFEEHDTEDVVLPMRFNPWSSGAKDAESVWEGLREPTLELKEALRKVDTDADVATVVSQLSALVKNAWILFGPVYLEEAEAAVLSGKYKPQGVWIPVNNVGAVDDSGAKHDSVAELRSLLDGRNEVLDRAKKVLEDSGVELEKLTPDPLPAVVNQPDGLSPGVVKGNVMDPQPPAQGQVSDEEEETEESPSPSSPSVSRGVCQPRLRTSSRIAAAVAAAGSPVVMQAAPSSSPIPVAVAAIAGSPVLMQATVVKQRRQKKKWSGDEEDTLKRGVEKYGKGRWKVILQMNKEVFQGRTEVDLKDKWRNLEKYFYL